MSLQRVGGGIGGAQHFDVETLEQGARLELRGGQFLRHLVVDRLGSLPVELLAHAEDVVELIGQPQPGGRAAEEVEVLGEELPDFAGV